MGEQNFQRTGMVSDEQIKKLGEMTGAAYILVAEGAVADESNLFVTAKILNVETGRIERTESALVEVAAKEMHSGCSNLAYNLFNNLTSGSGNTAASTSKSSGLVHAGKGNEGGKLDNTVATSKKEDQAAIAAHAKEQKRLEEENKRQEAERARQEQLEAQEREKQAKLKADSIRLAQKRQRADSIKLIKLPRTLIGLSGGIGVPITLTDKSDQNSTGFGGDFLLSFDFASPISDKFSMGFYMSIGGGFTILNGSLECYDYNGKSSHSYWQPVGGTSHNFKFTAGILMAMGDLTQKNVFLLGIGAGYGDPGYLRNRYSYDWYWLGIAQTIPLEFRFGGLFKKGLYFTIDCNISVMDMNPSSNFYFEPSIRVGYNFSNLLIQKKEKKE